MELMLDLAIWVLELLYLLCIAFIKAVGQVLRFFRKIFFRQSNDIVEGGKTFVRAFYFLDAMETVGGLTIEEANKLALSLFEPWSDPDADNWIIQRALDYAKQHHSGNQLPMIEEARAKGFTG